MPELKPRYRYMPRILSEFIVSIGSSVIELIGERVAKGILSRTAGPVGREDAEMMVEKLHLRGRNAMTHLNMRAYAGKMLGIEGEVVEESPERTVSKTLECPYGVVSEHFREPLLCRICEEYNRGMARYLDENMDFRWEEKIPEGSDFCLAVAEVEDPKDRKEPGTPTSKVLGKLGEYFADRDELASDTLSRLLLRVIEKVIEGVLGPNAGLIAARNAEEGGREVRKTLSEELDIGDSFKDSVGFVCEVRRAMGCDLGCDVSQERAEITIGSCPLAEQASGDEARFMEEACLHFTKGLLPGDGYGVELESDGCNRTCSCKQIIKKK